AQPIPAWRRPPRTLDRILSCRYRRVVARDNTVRLGPRWLQLPPGPGGRAVAPPPAGPRAHPPPPPPPSAPSSPPPPPPPPPPRSRRPRRPSSSRPAVIRTAIARGGHARRARRLDHSPRRSRPSRRPFAPHGPPRRPRPHPASVWPPRRRAIVPGGAMSVLPRMGQMRFLLRPRGPRSITPGAPPSRRANAASTRPSRGDIFTEQLAGHFHWTATEEAPSMLRQGPTPRTEGAVTSGAAGKGTATAGPCVVLWIVSSPCSCPCSRNRRCTTLRVGERRSCKRRDGTGRPVGNPYSARRRASSLRIRKSSGLESLL